MSNKVGYGDFNIEAFKKEQDIKDKIRAAKKANPDELGRVYLHVCNSGATFSIVDEGWGPTIKVQTSTFGNLQQTLTIHTDADSLAVLGAMFVAASRANFSDTYCNKAEVSSANILGKEMPRKEQFTDSSKVKE